MGRDEMQNRGSNPLANEIEVWTEEHDFKDAQLWAMIMEKYGHIVPKEELEKC